MGLCSFCDIDWIFELGRFDFSKKVWIFDGLCMFGDDCLIYIFFNAIELGVFAYGVFAFPRI